MTAPSSSLNQSLALRLADGQRWVITPADRAAVAILAGLGEVMQLKRACRERGPRVIQHEMCVVASDDPVAPCMPGPEAGGPVLCRLAAPTDEETRVTQMRILASQVARQALARGGLLLHAALAEYRGSGFIMAGPGTIGKSTASRRLPLPWRSLSDDMALVVRDGRGFFWAHPWPTWSQLLDGGKGGTWAVEDAVALRAVFFLDQSQSDHLEPVSVTQATALTLASQVELVVDVRFLLTDLGAARMLSGSALNAARALAKAVPAYSLRLSRDGRFWEKIERVLSVGDAPRTADSSRTTSSVESFTADDSLRVVCTGPSMNPTFDETDLLEVRPYATSHVRPGDVVCFKSPDTGRTVVHRVVSVDPLSGIKTRGDNNLNDDPGDLQRGDIIGRVTAAQRGWRRRTIPGGWRGLAALRLGRLGRRIRRGVGSLSYRLYVSLAGLGPFDRLLPVSLRPRLVRFTTSYQMYLKLMMGRRPVGQYEVHLTRWYIRPPFRFFVDERALPDPRSSPPGCQAPVPSPRS